MKKYIPYEIYVALNDAFVDFYTAQKIALIPNNELCNYNLEVMDKEIETVTQQFMNFICSLTEVNGITVNGVSLDFEENDLNY